MIGLAPSSSPGSPIITNSPERKRKLAGRSTANENSRSFQCRTHSTLALRKALVSGIRAGARTSVMHIFLEPRRRGAGSPGSRLIASHAHYGRAGDGSTEARLGASHRAVGALPRPRPLPIFLTY